MLVLDRLRMDDNFRIMNAIAPTEPAQVRRRKTRRRNCLVGVAALLSVIDAGLFYALCKGHGSFWE